MRTQSWRLTRWQQEMPCGYPQVQRHVRIAFQLPFNKQVSTLSNIFSKGNSFFALQLAMKMGGYFTRLIPFSGRYKIALNQSESNEMFIAFFVNLHRIGDLSRELDFVKKQHGVIELV